MKKNFKIIILILVIIIILGGIAFYFIHEVYPKNVLEKEVEVMSHLDLTVDTVDMNIKSSGKYATIEKSMKNYLNDYSTHLKKILAIMNDDEYVNVLSMDNYKKDGKEFKKTKEYLQKTKEEANTSFTKLIDMTSENAMMEYIDTTLGEKYIHLYQNYMYDDSIKKGLEDSKTSLEESKKILDNTLDVYEKVIDFLIKNKNEWKIESDSIIFNTSDLLNKYNELIKKL